MPEYLVDAHDLIPCLPGGTLPSELGRFSGTLTGIFSIKATSLTGTIPTELGDLVGLTDSLSLSSGSLTGSIPTEFGELTQLAKQLDMTANSLSSSIPTQVRARSNPT